VVSLLIVHRNRLKDNPIGVPMDPDELARKYHAGVPEEEIRRFSPSSGEIDPEFLRRMIEQKVSRVLDHEQAFSFHL
jgi:hypothetical protein